LTWATTFWKTPFRTGKNFLKLRTDRSGSIYVLSAAVIG
jgi:hypothetical protein